MRVFRGRAALADEDITRGSALAMGNFDGVHRGHQALVKSARDHAQKNGLKAGVLTFDPHPARFFAPQLAPPMLTSLSRRLELLDALELDFVVVEPFDEALAGMEAEPFVDTVLGRDLAVQHVVVGYDFRFGKGRRGDGALLTERAHALGISTQIVKQVSIDGLAASSTKIREFILEGRVDGAQMLLGRPCELVGRVVQGAQRGRGLGYPTANLEPEGELIPRPGIYAAWAVVMSSSIGAADSNQSRAGNAGGGAEPLVAPVGKTSGEQPGQTRGETAGALAEASVEASVEASSAPDLASAEPGPLRCPAAVSVGTNPTFSSDGDLVVEAHLLDFVGNLYGTRVRLEFVARLRNEQRFETVDALSAQIREDVAKTRALCEAF